MPADRRTPTLAQCLAHTEGRAFERRLHQARYYAGIDLGTSNSSVTLVDALALLRGDTDEAVRVLPIRQHTSRGSKESPLLPSVVAEVEPGEWWVGEGAREARSRGLLRGRQIFYSRAVPASPSIEKHNGIREPGTLWHAIGKRRIRGARLWLDRTPGVRLAPVMNESATLGSRGDHNHRTPQELS